MLNYWEVDTDLPSESPKGLAKVKKAAKAVPIVIDFGSWQCRAGFANETMPSLVFDQMVHRISNKDGSISFAVGRNAPMGVSKTSSRSAFDAGLLVHFTTVERTLDCIFDHLKQTDDSINHPVIISEPLANPPHIRDELIELLFEGYGVPRIAFTNDMVPALTFNAKEGNRNCLVLSFGHSFTCVGLYLNGQLTEARRLMYGGSQAAELLLKMMQCKYPSFPAKLSLSQATVILWKACMVAEDYEKVLRELESPEGISKHDFVVQFPYPVVDKALEAQREQQAAALLEKRKEMAERLKQRAEAKRMEKLRSKEDQYKALSDMLISIKKLAKKRTLGLESKDNFSDDTDVDDEHFEELRIHGFESIAELENAVHDAERDLCQFKNKLMGIVEEKEEPKYDLIDVPDNQLNEEQVKEKRKQKLLKASQDAREKIKIEKEKQAKVEEERAKQDDEWRSSDFTSWKSHYYSERTKLMSIIKSRQKQREALADRRSQASNARLKNVMSLVDADESDHEQQSSQSKRKKPKKKQSQDHQNELDVHQHENIDDDGFGANDSDWQIYRQIRRDELSDEEEDERDQERLAAIEKKLEEYDAEFYSVLAEEMSQKATIIDLLRNGGKVKVLEEESDAMAYQLHVNVERYRIPEVLFQPHIAGIEQAGVIEIVQDLLKKLDDHTVSSLLENIFLCGGWSQLPGLQDRVVFDLTKLFPVGTKIVTSKQSSTIDCWKGMSQNYDCLDWITK